MNVKEIVINYLNTNDYDGLCCDECNCYKDDLAPCESDYSSCQPAHIQTHSAGWTALSIQPKNSLTDKELEGML